MKANKFIKELKPDKSGYIQVVGGLVALLLLIILAVMVFWETRDSMSFDSVTETFTSDSDSNAFTRYTSLAGSNYTGEEVKLGNSESSITSVYVWNGTGQAAELCTLTTHYTVTDDRFINIVADSRSNFTQVNVTYISKMAQAEDSTGTMAVTVFDLLPIIALAVVASVIIGVIIGFGGATRKL